MASANSSGPIGSSMESSPNSTRSAVRAWVRPRRTISCKVVRPPSGAAALANPRAVIHASSLEGRGSTSGSTSGNGTVTGGSRSEVDDPLDPLGDLLEVVGPRTGRQVLPAPVADDEDDGALVDALGHPGRAGERRSGGDPGEDPGLVGEAPSPLQGLQGAHDALAVEQLRPAPLLVDRGDVAVVQAAQTLHGLADRRLDGEDLDGGVLLLQKGPNAEQRPAGAEAGHEVGDLRAVGPD